MFQRNKKAKQATTYVQLNTVASSHNAYTSSAILIALYFTRIQHFYGDFISQATTNVLIPSRKVSDIFFPILTKSVISRQILTEIPNIKFDVKPFSGSRNETCRQAD